MSTNSKALHIRLLPEEWLEIEKAARARMAPGSTVEYDEKTMKYFRPYLMGGIKRLSEAVGESIDPDLENKKQGKLFYIPVEIVGPLEILAKQRGICFSKLVDRYVLFPLFKEHLDNHGL